MNLLQLRVVFALSALLFTIAPVSAQRQPPSPATVIDASDIPLGATPVNAKKHPLSRSGIVKRIDTLRTADYREDGAMTTNPKSVFISVR